jgi:hypothetical protein
MTSDDFDSAEKLPVMPPNREVFEITRLGLPLELQGNLVCFMVIVLAIALQIRLSHTFLAEGIIAFGGFIGYVAMRYWLLTRRYPTPGDLVIENGVIYFPASVNGGLADSFELSNCIVKFYVNQGKSGPSKTSVEFRHGLQVVRINSLSLDLDQLDKALAARGVSIQREFWQIGLYAVGFMFIAILVFIAFMVLR